MNQRAAIQNRLGRADEALAGAVSELGAQRSNNAMNRAYYACFHLGVILRMLAGDIPERFDARDGRPLWAHGGTMARMNQVLNARNLPRLTPVPMSLLSERMRADYYADISDGVSLEAATAAVAQVWALRRTLETVLQEENEEQK
jgi:hypothetical protein